MLLLYYNNIMGPPSYIRSVVGRNVGMRRILYYRSASASRHAGWNILSVQGFSGNASAFGLLFPISDTRPSS